MLTAPGVTGSSAFVERESVSWGRSVTPPAYGPAHPGNGAISAFYRGYAAIAAGSDPLDQHREALPDPDAQGGEAALRVLTLHPAEQRDGQPRTTATERMPEGDRAAVSVDRVDVEAEPVDAG